MSELEIGASKHDAGLECEIARFASLTCCRLLINHTPTRLVSVIMVGCYSHRSRGSA